MSGPWREARSQREHVPLLVGREREQALLRDCLAAALAGRGNLALIGGEAGIGKTALAEWLLAKAQDHGALVLVGRCYDLSETPPYGPWVEAFARAPRDDDLPAPPNLAGDGTTSQAALFGRVRDYLVTLAARQSVVLLLDDLHWADPASLDLLRVVARGLGDAPLLLLATYRSDELTRHHPLYALLPLLVREARAERLDLRPLDEAGLRALVAGRYTLPPADEARLVTYLRGRAEGNPFFAGELLRALAEDGALCQADGGWALGDLAAVGVPPLLRQVLDARVDRLGEETHDLLVAAAVVGQEVGLGLWGTVAGADEAVLAAAAERAAEARLLAETPDGAGVRFAHALVRDALYEGTPGPRRRALHRRAGEALAAAPVPDPDAVASHFRRAGDPRAAEWLERGGERAQRAYAWLTAAARYEAAVAVLDAHGGDPAERGWLLYRLGRLHRLSHPALGMRYLDAAAAVAGGDHALAAWIAFDRGVMRCEGGDYRGGLADMAAGMAAFAATPAADRATIDAVRATWLADILPPEPPGSPPAVAMRPGVFALRLAVVGRYDEALAAAAPALAAASDGGPTDPLQLAGPADADFALGIAHAMRGRPDEARAAFGRARRRFRALEHHLVVGVTTLTELDLVLVPYRADDPAERRALATEGEGARARAGGLFGDRPHLHPQMPLLVLEGRWAEARPLALATPGPYAKAWLGFLSQAQGDTALAERLVREEVPDGPATAPGGTHLHIALALQRLAAALALAAGDLPAAQAWLQAHDRWLAWSGAVLGRAEGALNWAGYHRRAGDLTLAREHAERALAQASDPRQPLALLAAHRLLGELAAAAGDHTGAAAHLAESLALAEACAAPYERALTLLAWAEAHAATGAHGAARAPLDEARALLAPLEAQPALARADALAARLVALPAPAPAYPAGLTAREVAVLRLVAEGLTDAQVAERLFLSRHTVSTHLRAIYGKLGVENRAAATRFAVEHHLL
ncbi:MAG TPA: AAA family ATPase [Thermomicrobiales bacterium]|nr:AAA family ATPase [Thermomicrobiales bacterium]